MAQEYYTLERAAEVLRISTGEVNRMREQSQLRAFRDGSNWKFRKEDVEEALANMIKKKNQQEEIEEEEILTFGLEEEDAELPTLMAETDMSNTDDGLSLANEDSDLGLSLDLDDTINHGESDSIGLSEPEEDDQVVFGSGSDLNLSGGSGLSLVDPSEDDAALELDEDSDILALADSEEHSETPTLLADAESGPFDLVADMDEFEDSESSSQVIAIDDDSPFEAEMPMFDTNAFGAEADVFGPATETGDFGPVSAPVPKPAATGRSPYEATYSGKAVTALGLLCVLPVGLAGLMVYDLVRNMWSWTQPAVLSSPIVDMLAGMLGWK